MASYRSLRLRTSCALILGIAFPATIPSARGEVDAFWTNPDGGFWNVGTNWSTSPVFPDNDGAQTYDATIDLLADPYTVWLDTDISIDNFTLDSASATVEHTAGTFEVLGTANLLSGTYLLSGGTLAGGVWNVAPGALQVAFGAESRLEGVTINGDVELDQTFSALTIADGLDLNGTLSVTGIYSQLRFEGTQTLDHGTIRLWSPNGLSIMEVPTDGTLTLGSDAVVSGTWTGEISGNGTLVNRGLLCDAFTIAPDLLINEGTIAASLPGGTMEIGTSPENEWINASSGLLTATDATLDLNGTWSNAGLIQATNSSLCLGGAFTTAGLGTIETTNSEIYIDGTWDNTGDTFTWNAETGSWWLDGGTIVGGELNLAEGARLRLTGASGSRLDGVTLNGELDFSDVDYAQLRLRNGTTFQGDVTLGSGDILTLEDWAYFDDKTVHFTNGGYLQFSGAELSTVGPNFVAEGGGGGITSNQGNALVFQGRVTAVGSVGLGSGEAFTNEGQLEALPGGGLGFAAPVWTNAASGVITAHDATVNWQYSIGDSVLRNYGVIDLMDSTFTTRSRWENHGTINAVDSILNLGGDFTSADVLSINRTGGTVNITGDMDNTGQTVQLDESTGSWFLAGGSITGGTIQVADGEGLWLTDEFTSLLDGVDLQAPLDFSAREAIVRLANGTTFEGDVRLDGNGSVLALLTGQTFDHKTITFDSPGGMLEWFAPEGLGTLVLGSDVLIHGGGGQFWPNTLGPHEAPHVLSHAVVSADMPGESIELTAGLFGLTIDNQGTFEARDGGRLAVRYASVVTNLEGDRLNDGHWAVYANSTLEFPASVSIAVNDADILLSGVGSSFEALDELMVNLGRFALAEGRDFETAGLLVNEGELHLGAGSTLSVNGLFSQSDDGVLALDLGGLAPGDDFGLLEASGDAALAGGLTVDLVAGFDPAFGQEFTLLTAGSVTGVFDTLTFPTLAGGLCFEVLYGPSTVTLTVVPEPTTLLLLALAICHLRRR